MTLRLPVGKRNFVLTDGLQLNTKNDDGTNVASVDAIINQVVDDFFPIGVFSIDESFLINYVNQGTKNLLGDQPLIGISALGLVHPEDMSIIARTMADFTGGPRLGVPTPIRLLHQSGEYVPIECWVQKSFATGPVRFVMALRDATPENCLDRFLEGVQQQEPLDVVLKWLVRSLDSRAGASTHAIVWDWNGERFLQGVATGTNVDVLLNHPFLLRGRQKGDLPLNDVRGDWTVTAFDATSVPLFVADGSAATHVSLLVPAQMVDAKETSVCCVVSLSQHGIAVGAGAQLACERIAHFAQLAIAHSHRAAQVLHDSLTDSLTNLMNRRAICSRLENWILGKVEGAVVLIDLDGFKAVNDALGHAAGDDLLVEFSKRIMNAIGPYDFVGRLGGDEFAVLLHGTSRAVADAVVRLHRIFDDPFPVAGMSFSLGASLGSTELQIGTDDLESALGRADREMYRAKRNRQLEQISGALST